MYERKGWGVGEGEREIPLQEKYPDTMFSSLILSVSISTKSISFVVNSLFKKWILWALFQNSNNQQITPPKGSTVSFRSLSEFIENKEDLDKRNLKALDIFKKGEKTPVTISNIAKVLGKSKKDISGQLLVLEFCHKIEKNKTTLKMSSSSVF